MIKLTLNLIILFFLSSCITINQYENSSKPALDIESKDTTSNKPKSSKTKSSKMSKEAKEKLFKLAEDSGVVFGKCLNKLVRSGYMTKQERQDFLKKVTYGLKPENMILFANMTQIDKFCFKWVPVFSKKDSYVLDEELNKFWDEYDKRNKK